MGVTGDIWRRIRALRSRKRLDQDLADEIRLHIELRAAEYMNAGMPPEQAWRAARAAFGNPVAVRERSRDVWSFMRLETWLHDISFGARLLWRDRGWALAAMLTLGLGIGGSVATFTFVNAFLLRPLPFADPDRLVHIWATEGGTGSDSVRVSAADFMDFRREVTLFEELAAFNYTEEDLTGGPEPRRISVGRVTANAFSLLGVQPAIGRALAPGTDAPSGPREIVLSDRFWRTQFGADPSTVGRVLHLNAEPHTVVGIMPVHFIFPLPTTELWAPRVIDPAEPRGRRSLQVVGRLRPGIAPPQAAAELKAIAARLAERHPSENRAVSVRIVPLRQALNFASDILAPMSAVLASAVLFVFLIVCANVANLVLSRGVSRSREFAVRAALGAGRGRIVRQLVTESLLLALGGGLAGVLLAAWSLTRVATAVPPDLYRVGGLTIDRDAVGFALVVSLGSVLLFGVVPALRSTRPDPNTFLKAAGRTSEGMPRDRHWQRALIVGQIAVSTLLLVAAVVMARNLAELRRTPLGFDTSGTLTLKVILPSGRYPDAARVTSFHRQLLEATAGLPGVGATATVDYLPLNHEYPRAEIFAAGAPVVPGDGATANTLSISAAYFEVMGIPLLRGRAFSTADDRDAPSVAIVSRELAQTLFGTTDAVGNSVVRRVRSGADLTYTVVGVVGDTRHSGVREGRDLQMYVSQAQHPSRYFRLLVGAEGTPESQTAAAREIIRGLDPLLPVTEVRTLAAVVDEFLLPETAVRGALAEHAATALALALVGLYGVMAFGVARRMHEFGVRIALGASRATVQGLVVRQATRLGCAGIVIGSIAAFVLGRVLSAAVQDFAAPGPGVYAIVVALVLGCCLLAAFVPARRAASVDPVIALRAE